MRGSRRGRHRWKDRHNNAEVVLEILTGYFIGVKSVEKQLTCEIRGFKALI